MYVKNMCFISKFPTSFSAGIGITAETYSDILRPRDFCTVFMWQCVCNCMMVSGFRSSMLRSFLRLLFPEDSYSLRPHGGTSMYIRRIIYYNIFFTKLCSLQKQAQACAYIPYYFRYDFYAISYPELIFLKYFLRLRFVSTI